MSTSTLRSVDEDIRSALSRAACDASIHVRHLDDGREFGLDPDRTSVTASTYKVAVALEVACQAAEGVLSLTDRVHIPADSEREGNGISGTRDEVDISVRDLMLLMMQVSDNTATDVLQAMVGTDRINHRLAALGLTNTIVRLDCAGIIAEIMDDLGGEPEGLTDLQGGDPLRLGREKIVAALAASPALAGETGNVSTARDMTELLRMIWTDAAGPAEACAEVRHVMTRQFAPHRLSTAYPDGPMIAGKTGTFWGGIRNEVGVVDFRDGDRFAVAVFVRQHGYDLRDAKADAVIGEVARLAIDHLRGEPAR